MAAVAQQEQDKARKFRELLTKPRQSNVQKVLFITALGIYRGTGLFCISPSECNGRVKDVVQSIVDDLESSDILEAPGVA